MVFFPYKLATEYSRGDCQPTKCTGSILEHAIQKKGQVNGVEPPRGTIHLLFNSMVMWKKAFHCRNRDLHLKS